MILFLCPFVLLMKIASVLSLYDLDFNGIKTFELTFGHNPVIVAEQNIAAALLFCRFVYTKGLPCTLAGLPWIPTAE